MKRIINHIELLILINIIYAITPPQDGQIPQKYQKYFKNNNIGKDYGNSAWQYRLHSKQLARSTQIDDFFIPVIMADYTDLIGDIRAEDYKKYLFGNHSTGSFSDYYNEVSYGQFFPIGDVYGWYNTTKSKSKTVEDPISFVISALDLSDNDIDFTQFDNDGPDNEPDSGDDDGYVDGLIIIFPGKSAAASGSNGDKNNLWPYKSSLWVQDHDEYDAVNENGIYETNDIGHNGTNIKVYDYTLCPEKFGSNIHTIGVYVHEFGHILGLPDLYDRLWDSTNPLHETHEGIGVWGVMAAGAWLGNENAGDTPSHFSAWSKIKLGWVHPIEITSGSYLLTPVMNDGIIYKIIGSSYNDYPVGFNSEYFLLENRKKDGFDEEIPGDGMLIFHIDETIMGNTNQSHKQVDLEEADGNDDLDNEYNYGDDGDPYPGSSNQTEFSMSSYPNNFSYNNNSSVFNINSINQSSDDISFELQSNSIHNGEQIKYDTDFSFDRYGGDTVRDIYSGVLFQSTTNGNIKGIDIRLPGKWELNSYDDWEYVGDSHTFDIMIYEYLDNSGVAQNLLYNENISHFGDGWYHIDVDNNLFVNSGEEFFIVYKISNGTYDIYVDEDKENLSNRSYVYDGSYYEPIDFGNIPLRAWIETDGTQSSTIIGDINQNYELEIGDIIALIDIQQNIGVLCTLCDINSDSKMNVLDVVDLAYYILIQ